MAVCRCPRARGGRRCGYYPSRRRLEERQLAARRVVLPARAPATSLAFSGDGELLAEATRAGCSYSMPRPCWNVRVWDVERGMFREVELPRSSARRGLVTAVALDASGRLLAVANDEPAKSVVVVERRDGAILGTTRPRGSDAVETISFSPDGRYVAFGDGPRVRLWDADSKRLVVLRPQRGSAAVTDVAFSPDARILASSDSHGKIRLWDVRQRRPLGDPLEGMGREVSSLEFAPNGRLLVAAESSGDVTLWHEELWNPRAAIARLCALLGRRAAERCG